MRFHVSIFFGIAAVYRHLTHTNWIPKTVEKHSRVAAFALTSTRGQPVHALGSVSLFLSHKFQHDNDHYPRGYQSSQWLFFLPGFGRCHATAAHSFPGLEGSGLPRSDSLAWTHDFVGYGYVLILSPFLLMKTSHRQLRSTPGTCLRGKGDGSQETWRKSPTPIPVIIFPDFPH